MRFDYFKMVEDKYKARISYKRPIIIRLDGKGVCKNKEIEMLNEEEGGFAYALKGLAKFLSRRFKTLCLASSDEVSIIITDTNILKSLYEGDECQKISSLVAQESYVVFNRLYNGEEIKFDARTFNIHENRVKSYVKYRVGSAKNVCAIYVAKTNVNYRERKGKKLNELEELLSDKVEGFADRSEYSKIGMGYYCGEIVELVKFIDSNSEIDDCAKFIVEEIVEIVDNDYEEELDCLYI